jgi:hypothetical protein
MPPRREPVPGFGRCLDEGYERRNIMPVILLWGIPAIIFVGGVGYFLVHATH